MHNFTLECIIFLFLSFFIYDLVAEDAKTMAKVEGITIYDVLPSLSNLGFRVAKADENGNVEDNKIFFALKNVIPNSSVLILPMIKPIRSKKPHVVCIYLEQDKHTSWESIVNPGNSRIVVTLNNKDKKTTVYNLQYLVSRYLVYPKAGPSTRWEVSINDEKPRTYYHNPQFYPEIPQFGGHTILKIFNVPMHSRITADGWVRICNQKFQARGFWFVKTSTFVPDYEGLKCMGKKDHWVRVREPGSKTEKLYLMRKIDKKKKKTYRVKFLNYKQSNDVDNNIQLIPEDIGESIVMTTINNKRMRWLRYLDPEITRRGFHLAVVEEYKGVKGVMSFRGFWPISEFEVGTEVLIVPQIVRSGNKVKCKFIPLQNKKFSIYEILSYINQISGKYELHVSLSRPIDDPTEVEKMDYNITITHPDAIPEFPKSIQGPQCTVEKRHFTGETMWLGGGPIETGMLSRTLKDDELFFDRLSWMQTPFGKACVSLYQKDSKTLYVRLANNSLLHDKGVIYIRYNAGTIEEVLTRFYPKKWEKGEIELIGWKDASIYERTYDRIIVKDENGKEKYEVPGTFDVTEGKSQYPPIWIRANERNPHCSLTTAQQEKIKQN